MKKGSFIIFTLLLSGCLGYPDTVNPVQNFQLERYLGTWYEIVRLDHSFERGLEKVTANYSLRDDGGVKVINRGFSTEKKEWQGMEGLYDDYRRAFDEMFLPRGSAAPRITCGKMLCPLPGLGKEKKGW